MLRKYDRFLLSQGYMPLAPFVTIIVRQIHLRHFVFYLGIFGQAEIGEVQSVSMDRS